MNEIREKLQRFMIGRYGMDELGKTMSNVLMVLIVASFFIHIRIVNMIVWLGIFFMLFRMFSRNIPARTAENEKYLTWKANRKNRSASPDRIYQCPKCGQKVRVPKGKGKISIRCPRCNNEFIKRT